MAWEVLASGLRHLQAKYGLPWQVETPFFWLRGAESNASDRDRATFFLTVHLISSIAGMTTAAVKTLLRSPALPELRGVLVELRADLNALRDAADPAVAARLRDACSLLGTI